MCVLCCAVCLCDERERETMSVWCVCGVCGLWCVCVVRRERVSDALSPSAEIQKVFVL